MACFHKDKAVMKLHIMDCTALQKRTHGRAKARSTAMAKHQSKPISGTPSQALESTGLQRRLYVGFSAPAPLRVDSLRIPSSTRTPQTLNGTKVKEKSFMVCTRTAPQLWSKAQEYLHLPPETKIFYIP